MSHRIRAHIRNNVYGLIAIFIALGGTAYAVDGPLAGTDQVGSGDIINNEVQSADIKDANVATSDIRSGSVTSGKVLDGDLTSLDVDDDSLAADDIGPAAIGTSELASLPHAVAQGFTQTVADGTVTTIAFGGTASISDITFDNAADSFTIAVPGLYQLVGSITWSSNATGRRVVQVQVNGNWGIEDSRDAVSSARTSQSVTTFQRLEAGDVITLRGQQTSGGNLDTAPSGAPDPELNIFWVGP